VSSFARHRVRIVAVEIYGNRRGDAVTKALVCGAGGFIASHLVRRLKQEGNWVRGVDIKVPEFAPTAADDFRLLDLREPVQIRIVGKFRRQGAARPKEEKRQFLEPGLVLRRKQFWPPVCAGKIFPR